MDTSLDQESSAELLAINLPLSEIASIGTKIAERLDYQPGSDLTPIVARLGGRVHYQDLNDWFDSETGSIQVHGKRDFDIYLSNFSSSVRDRFTIAHELGHFVLHFRMGELTGKVARHGSNRLETEAHWFAAGFLMPESIFAAKANELGRQELARFFGVSIQAVDVRKKILGCAK